MVLISTHLVKKYDLGFHGNLYGGKALSWADEAGASYAMQICDTPRMVTLSLDKCVFTKPAKEGQVVKIYGEIESIGNTSITINLEMRIHNVRTGKQDIIVHTKMKFVSIDEEGNSLPITEKVKNKYKKLEVINN
jgi:acyl-CoA hydrolase